ncbi:MAG: sortase [Candidatus Sumerlaeota bacterium]|nr:sortase [Candidatus Sumerlaeota bacterium]
MPASRNRMPRVRLAQAGLVVLAGVLLARPAGHAAGRFTAERSAARAWSDVRSGARPPAPGDPVARLRIASAGLDINVLDDATEENLHRLPALSRQGQSATGGDLKIVLGHRDTHFNALKHVTTGDMVLWDTHMGGARYRVASVSVTSPEDVEARLETLRGADRLVLVTCFPFRYLGSAPDRWLAVCERVR